MKWHWQYLLPPILLFCSIDWVLMPLLRKFGLAGWPLFLTSSPLAVTELLIWSYWGKWFRSTAMVEFAKKAAATEEIQEAISLGKEIRADLKKAGTWKTIESKAVNYSFNTFKKTTDPNSRLMKWVKRGGNIGMLLLGISPEPGTRAFGAICCGTTGWRNGLYPLVLGNVLRIAYMVGIWNVIFKLFE